MKNRKLNQEKMEEQEISFNKMQERHSKTVEDFMETLDGYYIIVNFFPTYILMMLLQL